MLFKFKIISYKVSRFRLSSGLKKKKKLETAAGHLPGKGRRSETLVDYLKQKQNRTRRSYGIFYYNAGHSLTCFETELN